MRPPASHTARAIRPRPDSSMPQPARISACSPGSSSPSSASSRADKTIEGACSPAESSPTFSADSPPLGSSSSAELATYTAGLSVTGKTLFISSLCSRSSARVRNGWPASRCALASCRTSFSAAASFLPARTSLATISRRRSTEARSARTRSSANSSSSATGCGSGPKQRASLTNTSDCRANATRCARLPGGVSSTRTCAGVTFNGLTASASRCSRSSGTSTIPTTSAPRPAVSALNSVVLPDPAGPTIATLTGIYLPAIQLERLVKNADSLLHLVSRDQARDADLGGADHLDVDAGVRKGSKHAARDARHAQHARADDRKLGDSACRRNPGGADLSGGDPDQLHGSLQIRFRHRECQVGAPRSADVLDYDVD